MCGPYSAFTWLQIDSMIRKIALISYNGPICSLFGDDFFVKGFENLKEHFQFFPELME